MSDGMGLPLSEDVIIRLAGWDSRFARVLLIEPLRGQHTVRGRARGAGRAQ
jgi:hypothetical protein